MATRSISSVSSGGVVCGASEQAIINPRAVKITSSLIFFIFYSPLRIGRMNARFYNLLPYHGLPSSSDKRLYVIFVDFQIFILLCVSAASAKKLGKLHISIGGQHS
jgi:hypothetical protein